MAPTLTPKATTVDEYLAALPPDKRAALQWLRARIKAAAPGAEECISYGIPAFRLNGRLLVGFGAAKTHCSFYPGAMVQSLGADLDGYDTSKGTIRFQADRPLPASLVRKIVKVRAAERAARRSRR